MAKKETQKSNNPTGKILYLWERGKHGLILKIGERWLWFRYAFDEDKKLATKQEMHELMELYLARNDEEIDQLEAEREKGHRKPKTPRQSHLEALKDSELNEYISGMGK